ncbi:hypothetical protein RYX36_027345 [Vicia faba]
MQLTAVTIIYYLKLLQVVFKKCVPRSSPFFRASSLSSFMIQIVLCFNQSMKKNQQQHIKLSNSRWTTSNEHLTSCVPRFTIQNPKKKGNFFHLIPTSQSRTRRVRRCRRRSIKRGKKLTVKTC